MLKSTKALTVNEQAANFLEVVGTWAGDEKVFVATGLGDGKTNREVGGFIGLTPDQARAVAARLMQAATNAERVSAGDTVRLTILDLERKQVDLDYLRRVGKYSDTERYGETLDGGEYIVESIDEYTWRGDGPVAPYKMATLVDDRGARVFLADLSELTVIKKGA